MQPSVKHLKSLGTKTKYDYEGANANLLERFQNPFYNQYTPDDTQGVIQIRAPEFTSLCPKTGQPDFATIVVDYEPEWWCVESKSYKLYLGSYRQHKSFHETCVKMICDDLVLLLEPRWIQVQGLFTPRGGISFWPKANWQKPKGADGVRYCNDKDRRESQLLLMSRLDRAAKRK